VCRSGAMQLIRIAREMGWVYLPGLESSSISSGHSGILLGSVRVGSVFIKMNEGQKWIVNER